MVLTDEQQQSIYPAVTLEGTGAGTDPVAVEKNFYSIQDAYIVPNATATGISSYQNNNGNPPANNNPNCSNTSVIKQTDLSQKLYKLNSSTNKTGLGITLKVMAGDKVNIFGKSYYFQNNTGGSSVNAAIPVSDLVSNLLGTPTGVTAGKAVAADLTGNSAITGLLTTFLNKPEREDAGNPQKPKAAINWLLLDENFRYVAGNFSAVGAANTVKDHYSDVALQNIPVTKNGYLYVYVSNESPVNVFFDNLQVIHDKSALLEETHYYTFGLTMAGISSKAINKLENKFKFNDGTELASKEFSDGSGLDLYETEFRSYDPQIGRFHQMDLLMEFYEGWSPYTFALNNPILLNDPLGLASDTTTLPEVIVTPRGPDPMSPICLSCNQPSPDPSKATASLPLPATPGSGLYPVPPPGKVVPFNEPTPIPMLAPNPIVLIIIGLLIPVGGPEFPGNDETVFHKHPELYRTLDPHPRPDPNIKSDDPNKPPLYLIRFGNGPERAADLASDAARALAGGFPHGVSTALRFRISGTDKKNRSALLKEVMRYFGVKKTGTNINHYTVILPNPVTQEVADLFNSLFKQR